jgi:DNA-binding phage protein
MLHRTKSGLHFLEPIEWQDPLSDALDIANSLNSRNTDAEKQALELVRQLKQIEELAEKAGFPEWPYKGALRSKTEPVFKSLQKYFKRFAYELSHPTKAGWEENIRTKVKYMYSALVVFAARRGLLRHIRECTQCGRWFAARRRDQHFCSAKCREKAFRKNPQGRSKRAAYMRGYRARLKRLECERMRVIRTPRR